MERCHPYQKRFSAYLDGELPPKKQAAISNHLAVCAACRAKLSALEGLGLVLGRLDAAPPPADMAARIVAAARRKQAERDSRPLVRRWSVPIPTWSWGLKAFGAAAMLVLMFYCGQLMSTKGWLPGPSGGHAAMSANAGRETEGLEWFTPGPPGSLLSGYLAMAGQPLPASGTHR